MKFNILKRKLMTFVENPKIILIKFLYTVSSNFQDEKYLKMLFPLKMGYPLNLENPLTYNEKLQWLKLNYRNPLMTKMVDKFSMKEVAKKIIGEKYIIESYGVWNSFDEIEFENLPRSFVLKTTHDQGGVIIVKDKDKIDKAYINSKLTNHLKTKHYFLSREWPYKNVQPKIMAEAILVNEDVGDLYDYKFYCFHGEPKVMYIAHGRQNDTCYLDFYDMEFNKLDITRPNYPQSDKSFEMPENWELMKELAKKLSIGFPHLRVDFYNINGKIYLGELTFFQGGGLMPFKPHEWDHKLGSWIDLEEVKKSQWAHHEDC